MNQFYNMLPVTSSKVTDGTANHQQPQNIYLYPQAPQSYLTSLQYPQVSQIQAHQTFHQIPKLPGQISVQQSQGNTEKQIATKSGENIRGSEEARNMFEQVKNIYSGLLSNRLPQTAPTGTNLTTPLLNDFYSTSIPQVLTQQPLLQRIALPSTPLPANTTLQNIQTQKLHPNTLLTAQPYANPTYAYPNPQSHFSHLQPSFQAPSQAQLHLGNQLHLASNPSLQIPRNMHHHTHILPHSLKKTNPAPFLPRARPRPRPRPRARPNRPKTDIPNNQYTNQPQHSYHSHHNSQNSLHSLHSQQSHLAPASGSGAIFERQTRINHANEIAMPFNHEHAGNSRNTTDIRQDAECSESANIGFRPRPRNAPRFDRQSPSRMHQNINQNTFSPQHHHHNHNFNQFSIPRRGRGVQDRPRTKNKSYTNVHYAKKNRIVNSAPNKNVQQNPFTNKKYGEKKEKDGKDGKDAKDDGDSEFNKLQVKAHEIAPKNMRYKPDWICPNEKCRNRNFAKRIVCNRCGTDKPHNPEYDYTFTLGIDKVDTVKKIQHSMLKELEEFPQKYSPSSSKGKIVSIDKTAKGIKQNKKEEEKEQTEEKKDCERVAAEIEEYLKKLPKETQRDVLQKLQNLPVSNESKEKETSKNECSEQISLIGKRPIPEFNPQNNNELQNSEHAFQNTEKAISLKRKEGDLNEKERDIEKSDNSDCDSILEYGDSGTEQKAKKKYLNTFHFENTANAPLNAENDKNDGNSILGEEAGEDKNTQEAKPRVFPHNHNTTNNTYTRITNDNTNLTNLAHSQNKSNTIRETQLLSNHISNNTQIHIPNNKTSSIRNLYYIYLFIHL